MAKLKVPSLQHLARNWDSDSGYISKSLVRVARNPPFFNYNRLFSAAFDLIYLKQPVDQVIKGISRGEKREVVRDNFLEVVPLLATHFADISPDFVNPVSTRQYPISQDLMIPFRPPLVYGMGGQLYFPWLSFWRSNPLKGEKLSLFVTLVKEVLSDDPDLESAKFEIIDFSANADGARDVNVINADDIPVLDYERKIEMLSVFEEGFIKAQAVLANEPAPERPSKSKNEQKYDDDDLQDFFDF